MNPKGKLYLIPSPLGDYEPGEVLPAPLFDAIAHIGTFVVEETRTARRFLSKAGFRGRIDGLVFHELNEHSADSDAEQYVRILESGVDVGLISEAGLPAVADPGSVLVRLAHSRDIEVVPFVGPSSLMLALMSSGMNGQSFAFVGYLPVKPEERRAQLKALEKKSAQSGQTQIMIETPYRNDSLLKEMLAVLSPQTDICLAANITCPDAFIRTRSVAQWRSAVPTIGKRPCVFLLSAKK
ncbi:MAG: SAM-dependent methyltransferase [Bacteroidales bacterium]|nr:SAM-dependent methyltransferase [Bacteroidales bacterium]